MSTITLPDILAPQSVDRRPVFRLFDHALPREPASAPDRNVLQRSMFGIIKTAGHVLSRMSTRPGYRPAISAAIRAELDPMLRPGDILFTRKEHAVTNYFLPGYWPHSALYLGDAATLVSLGIDELDHIRHRWSRIAAAERDDPRRVLEAMKDGVHIRPLQSPMNCDSVVLVRPRLDRDEIATALARGLLHEGKPYDFDFDFSRSDCLVCTEVVYRSYRGLGNIRFRLRRRARRLTLTTDDLLRMALEGRGFEVIAAYLPTRSAELCAGAEADTVVDDALAGA
ncbi:MAG TPA: YiiX/YebB-like N1pC/P60 family cysteine hydrolase [Pirellulales bacterium]|jgi:hypothetical protein|nr:YiiX/YebB-like N1pC/P60 family cysteine hydrolase [Pirellulales bacterium]